MSDHVYITGIGIVTSIGNNVKETVSSLLEGRSGIGDITLFPTIHRGIIPVAEVKSSNAVLADRAGYAGRNDFTRTSLLGILAASEAARMANISKEDGLRTGLISATTVGGMDRSESFYADFLADPAKGKLRDVVNHDCGDSTERIADHLGVRGYVTTVSTACSSSVNALMTGCGLIRNGLLDRVIVGGADSLTRFTLNGFNTLMILDKTGCHPFDADRAGLTLGEGAAFLVLESADAVERSGKTVLARVKGYGNANDAYHQTASSPEGTGAFLAMSKAMEMSGLNPGSIDYINVHGTGTQNNDLSEGIAMKRIFGDPVPRFSSTKGFTGHTLGAAGAVEMVISILSLQHQTLWPNLGFRQPIPELGMIPVTKTTPAAVHNVLSNSFGFGGNNSSVILGK